MQKRGLIIFNILLCALIIFNLNLQKAYADTDNNSDVKMKIKCGIEGKYRYGTDVPVNVEVENNSPQDINGQAEVQVQTNEYNTYNAFVSDISIKSNEKQKVIIPVNLSDNTSKIKVVLKDGDKVIKESTNYIGNGRVSDGNILTGMFTDDANGIQFKSMEFQMSSYGDGTTTKNISLTLDKSVLSQNYKSISPLDIIIINNYNVSQFSEDEYKNLLKWVDDGGLLIIGTGENSAKTIKDNKFGIVYNGTHDASGITFADIQINGAEETLRNDYGALMYGIKEGKGHIYVATFDLSNNTICKDDSVITFWKEAVGRKLSEITDNNYYGNGNDYSYAVRQLIDNIPMNDELNITVLIIIFAVYCITIGIIIYFVMKKLGRRELLWIVIPACSVILSIVLFIMGNNTRIKDIALNQVNFIVSDGSNNESIVKGYAGTALKKKGKLVVTEPDNITLSSLDDENYYGGIDNTSSFEKLNKKIVYKKNNSYVEFKEVTPLEMKKFSINGYKQIVPAIEGKFRYDSEKLKGTVKNTLGCDVNSMLLVSSNNVWNLGSFKAGEEKTIDSKFDSNMYLEGYNRKLEDDYYNNYSNAKGSKLKEKYKNVQINCNVFEAINDMNMGTGESYLVAITDMPIDYGFQFNNKSISTYNTTAVIQNVNVDYTDKDGFLKYPLGYFKENIISSTQNIYVDTRYNEINGGGEAELKYNIDKNIKVEHLYLGKLDSSYKSNGISKIFIYNFEKGEYEEIKVASTQIEIKNIEKYIENGSVKIKVQLEEDGNAQIPQISVKGRAA